MSNDELQKAIDDITSGDAAATEATSSDAANEGTAAVPLPDEIDEQQAEDLEKATNALEDFAGPAPAVNASADSFGMPMMPPSGASGVTEESAAADLIAAANKKMAAPGISGFRGNVVTPVMEAPEETKAVEMPAPNPAETAVPAPEVPEMPSVPEMSDAPEVKMPELSKEGPKDAELKEVETAALIELYPLLEKMNVNAREKFDICIKVIEKTGEKGATSAALSAAKEIVDEKERGECLIQLVEMIEKM